MTLGAAAAAGSASRTASQQVPRAAGATTPFIPGGTTTFVPGSGQALPAVASAAPAAAEVLVESPTATAAGRNARGSAAGSPGLQHIDTQPQVDSPADLDMGVGDFLQNLQSMNSAELMMTDDINKDDLWDVLFGGQQHPAGPPAAAAASPGLHPTSYGVGAAPLMMHQLPAVGSPGLPGMDHDGLDPAMAAALTVPASISRTAAAGDTHMN